MFIQNVAYIDVINGNHFDVGERGVLIQIVDVGWEYPKPKAKFEEIHQFTFSDMDELGKGNMLNTNSKLMTQEQAKAIVEVLKRALEEKRNVIVHCFAGLCRSGAVAEVGVMMGFTDTETYRQPNTWVKKLLMKELGWTYEEQQATL